MTTNEDMIHHLIATGALKSQNIIDAFKRVDRGDFTPKSFFSEIYGDYPLSIGHGQTISQPTTVAIMLEMLQPHYGNDILDIGSGSGYTTALLASISKKGHVIALERIPELVKLGKRNISKYNFKNATIMKAASMLGIPSRRFDRILVSASAEQFPHELVKQLKVGGRLVVPVRNSIFEVYKKSEDKIERFEHYGFMFVPLIY